VKGRKRCTAKSVAGLIDCSARPETAEYYFGGLAPVMDITKDICSRLDSLAR
jgi:hypothetical protein